MSDRRQTKKTSRSRKKAGGEDDLNLGSDKLYFKIGEVAEIIDVPSYVLRYWESEFRSLRPQKSRSQQRVYRRKDVEVLLKIKHLLYERKFTIAGARQELEKRASEVATAAPSGGYIARQSLSRLREQLDAMAREIEGDAQVQEIAADPAEYLRARGGAQAILEGTSELFGSPQPLLDRPERKTL